MVRVSIRIQVQGQVQGVGYRATLREEAMRRNVDGWVRNKDDGSVEALLQGDERAVRSVIEWAKIGPPRASVTSVDETAEISHPAQIGFEVLI
jgi:acylphosphatase